MKLIVETNEQLQEVVALKTNLSPKIIQKVVALLEEGNTVPFIARYRKEVTGGLDETKIKEISDEWTYAVSLSKRKTEVLRLIEEQGKLTAELTKEIIEATQLQRVEDLYRPYRQKRRTRATIAKERGLEPLATLVWKQTEENVSELAKQFVSEEKELPTTEDVLEGVNDIIAEWISDHAEFREYIRWITFKKGWIVSEVKDDSLDERKVYEMYYEYKEPLNRIASHRILALNRGEKEDVLRVKIENPDEQILTYLEKKIIKEECPPESKNLLTLTIEDSYKRLIQPSINREIRNHLSENAETQAIEVFSKNLQNLLLQPPLKDRVVLGIDPAYRTGCKNAVVDETGKVHAINVMYPTPPKKDYEGSEQVVLELIESYHVELIAIGNGTASRETEQFIAEVIQKNNLSIPYIIVNEAGASVYSASPLAREEFPDLEVEERSAVSIARRVQDPLAELVKIDPKSIGVGQYQHDVTQRKLEKSLDFVVETAVNQVGVNVNTASAPLLERVSGLNRSVANNIIKRRNELGKYTNRNQLKEVPRLGPKTFEQSIGFLRILDGDHPLDRTPIHPESYSQAEKLLKMLSFDLENIGSKELQEALENIDLKEIAKELDIGELTLADIIEALQRPERDPRDDFPQPLLQQNIITLEDLRPGMEMQGTVRNVVDFGAFVDIGVGQDGLVHISKLATKYVEHPMDIVQVGDVVTVWVENVDPERRRIALTMIKES